VLKPVSRIRLLEIEDKPANFYPFANVEHLEETESELKSDEDQALLKLLLEKFENLRGMLGEYELRSLESLSMRYNMRYNAPTQLRRCRHELPCLD
jgi:hypothetical protein